jgi:hypothetical protein
VEVSEIEYLFGHQTCVKEFCPSALNSLRNHLLVVVFDFLYFFLSYTFLSSLFL